MSLLSIVCGSNAQLLRLLLFSIDSNYPASWICDPSTGETYNHEELCSMHESNLISHFPVLQENMFKHIIVGTVGALSLIIVATRTYWKSSSTEKDGVQDTLNFRLDSEVS